MAESWIQIWVEAQWWPILIPKEAGCIPPGPAQLRVVSDWAGEETMAPGTLGLGEEQGK